jgi:hypothetical protein
MTQTEDKSKNNESSIDFSPILQHRFTGSQAFIKWYELSKMPQSSTFVWLKLERLTTNITGIPEELKPIFSSSDEMKRTFSNRVLAAKSIKDLQYRAWEVRRDFCNGMVQVGGKKKLQDTEGFRMYFEWYLLETG